jgi:PKD repeat protein
MRFHHKASWVLLLILMAGGLFGPVTAADQPTADFGVQNSFTHGVAPFTAQFVDHSALAASWFWDFGDGQTSSGQSPSHTYANPGTYTVSLTVYEATGTLSSTKTIPDCILVDADPMGGGVVTTVITPHYVTTTTTTDPYAAETPALSGIIVINSQPAGAMVSLDAAQQGITPITLYRIPAGSHTVLVHLKGYPDNRTAVVVEPERTITIGVDFLQAGKTTETLPVYSATTTPITTSPVESQAMKAAAPALTPASGSLGSIRIYCTGCLERMWGGRPISRVDYQVYLSDPASGKETSLYFDETKASNEAEILNVPPGFYKVKVIPENFKSQMQFTNVSPSMESAVRFSGPSFVQTPGFEALAAILGIAGIAGLRRFR